MATLNEIAGRNIRAHRKRQYATLREVSAGTGVSLSYLSEIERGAASISLATLEVIAAALQVSPLVLLGVDSDEHGRRLEAEGRLRQIAAIAAEGAE